jgi:nicotinamide mononucleotide adenylyltransferase
VLLDDGIPLERVLIIPFPVNLPERWRYYVPRGVMHFVRVFSDWEQAKVDRLRAEGYRAEVLTPGADKEFEATEVRRRLDAGEDWESLVPPGTARVLRARARAAAGSAG